MSNLINQKFGFLTVIERDLNRKNDHNIFWKCLCECGKITSIQSSSLLSGCTKSCGHLKKSKEIYLVGKIIGRLTILHKEEMSNDKGRKLWLCQCNCGNFISLPISSLKLNNKGGTKSCGCLHKERFHPDFKQCKNRACIIKPINEFKVRFRKKKGKLIKSTSSYCKECEKLHKYISRRIWAVLGCHKNREATFKYLNYTIEELTKYIENLFEPWMNWENRGVYRPKKWNDNDPTTWKWQLDHIAPANSLLFTSMTDVNFKKCWALDNLRPLSAKQNVSDGDRRTPSQIAAIKAEITAFLANRKI